MIAQAGGSARGRTIAARYADTIVAHPKGVDMMKDYYIDVRGQMAAMGRDPNACKILFMAAPILAGTAEEARARADQRKVDAANNLDKRLAQLGWITNIDFSTFDLDAPVGELSTNGHQSSLAGFLRKAGKNTLREAIIDYSSAGSSVDLVGTPEQVAGADGRGHAGGRRRRVPDHAAKCQPAQRVRNHRRLVPALQQRGAGAAEVRASAVPG